MSDDVAWLNVLGVSWQFRRLKCNSWPATWMPYPANSSAQWHQSCILSLRNMKPVQVVVL